MGLPAQGTKYSLLWALSVVQRLAIKYPRATESTNEFYGITEQTAAMWLARGTKRWTNYRLFVKTVEKWYLQQEACRKRDANCGVLSYKMAVEALDRAHRQNYA